VLQPREDVPLDSAEVVDTCVQVVERKVADELGRLPLGLSEQPMALDQRNGLGT
jgi:hypothetical protein